MGRKRTSEIKIEETQVRIKEAKSRLEELNEQLSSLKAAAAKAVAKGKIDDEEKKQIPSLVTEIEIQAGAISILEEELEELRISDKKECVSIDQKAYEAHIQETREQEEKLKAAYEQFKAAVNEYIDFSEKSPDAKTLDFSFIQSAKRESLLDSGLKRYHTLNSDSEISGIKPHEFFSGSKRLEREKSHRLQKQVEKALGIVHEPPKEQTPEERVMAKWGSYFVYDPREDAWRAGLGGSIYFNSEGLGLWSPRVESRRLSDGRHSYTGDRIFMNCYELIEEKYPDWKERFMKKEEHKAS